MKTKRPANREEFIRFKKKIFEIPALARIDGIFIFHIRIIIKAYYGGYIRAGLALIRFGIRDLFFHYYWTWVYLASDTMGWTQLYKNDGWPGCFIRHGRYCENHESCKHDCIEKSVPRWYQKLTFWGDNSPEDNERNQ